MNEPKVRNQLIVIILAGRNVGFAFGNNENMREAFQ